MITKRISMELYEDKNFGGNRAYIDLTDIGEWGKHGKIEEYIGQKNWIKIQEHIKNRVNDTCELCNASKTKEGVFGQKAHKFKIEFRHEVDERDKKSTLKRIMYVCASCSQMIHLRQTQLMGIEPYKRAVERLCKVHNMQPYEVEQEMHKKLDVVKARHENGIPSNIELNIIEDGINRLWTNK